MAFWCGFCPPDVGFQGLEYFIFQITPFLCGRFSCNLFVAEMRNCHSRIVFCVTGKRLFMVRFLLFFDIFLDDSVIPENVLKVGKP